MNNNAVIYMNTRRPQSRKSVYSPARTRRHRREAMLAAAVDGFCYLAVMVCLIIGITVLIALV